MYILNQTEMKTISGGDLCKLTFEKKLVSSNGFSIMNSSTTGDCKELQLKIDSGYYNDMRDFWVARGYDFNMTLTPVIAHQEL